MYRMKFSLFVLVALSGCAKKTNGYVLKGTIDGLPDGKIYIQQLTDSGFRFVDSANIRQHGFVFKGVIPEPEMISLLFQGSQSVEFLCSSFFLENEVMNVTGSLSDRSRIKVSSSPENDAMKEMERQARRPARYVMLQNLLFRHQQNQLSLSEDSLKKIRFEVQQLDTAYKKQLFMAITSHKDSYVAVHTLLNNLPLFSIDELRIIGQAFSASIQQSRSYEPVGRLLKLAKSVNAGERLEDFSLPDSLQKLCSLSNASRPYLLVEFWASWCGPCRKQLPALKRVYASETQNKLDIISISIDENAAAWKKALEEEKMPWLNLLSSEKDWAKNHYLISYIPASFLLDSNRNIIAKNLSPYEIAGYVNGYNVH